MKQRCMNCSKLLAIGISNFAIKCPRCKHLNQINTQKHPKLITQPAPINPIKV